MVHDLPFCHRFRIRYAEVDSQKVVFNSRYLEYADIILTEYWRSCGVPLGGDPFFEAHVVQASVHYVKPLRFDDEIDGWIGVKRIGRSSLTTSIELHGVGSQDLRARMELVHVNVNLATGLPVEITAAIRKAFGLETQSAT